MEKTVSLKWSSYVDLEDVRLVQVWRVKEGWVKMKRGGGTYIDRVVEDGRPILFGACRENISKATEEGRRRSSHINMVKPGDGERS